MKKIKKGWTPSNWAGYKPFGIGEQRPKNFLEIWKAFRENRDQLPYAWRILTQGVCDGCALGTTGMKDWTLPGVHLCNIRLRLLRLNTMPALDIGWLKDVSALEGKDSAELRGLGRLPYPMLRRPGEPGFSQVSWEDALELIATRIRACSPERLGFYLTSRGMPNESYYAAQKAVRAMGTNSIDNAARVCHSPSTSALKNALGVAATTCSYQDWLCSDLIVFVGSNVANNQPVAIKYLHYAKKAGARIEVINNYHEPGMARYWIPSVMESALFGTKIADQFFRIHAGGDIAFLNGTLKHMIDREWTDRSFVEEHTSGFEEMNAVLQSQSWEELEGQSGASRDDMLRFAESIAAAKRAVFVWSMGITQHEFGEQNVSALINLALSKGFVGRTGCGLMPIRGHSGVQGGAEMGAYATVLPGGKPIDAENVARFSDLWGFEVPHMRGLTAPEMIDAAHKGALEVLFSCGGNFLEVLPDPKFVKEALERVELRVHMDIVLTSQMLLEAAEAVLLLPAATRYEIPGGVTETSTERRIIFSPEVLGPRIGQARAEWEVFIELAQRVRPDLADKLHFEDTAAIREEIAQANPTYNGIQDLKKAGDQIQYGGEHLCWNWTFPTPEGKACFARTPLPEMHLPEGAFILSTRRGKQFNSMVQEEKDAITGAARKAVIIGKEDAQRLKLTNGDPVVLTNGEKKFRGHAYIAPIMPGNLQVHWPEGNALIEPNIRSPVSGMPDYNAVVWLEKVESFEAHRGGG